MEKLTKNTLLENQSKTKVEQVEALDNNNDIVNDLEHEGLEQVAALEHFEDNNDNFEVLEQVVAGADRLFGLRGLERLEMEIVLAEEAEEPKQKIDEMKTSLHLQRVMQEAKIK